MHDPTIASIRINGGRLCLDFVNTATWTDGRPDWDFFGSFGDAAIKFGKLVLNELALIRVGGILECRKAKAESGRVICGL